jgi:hypothetical protein
MGGECGLLPGSCGERIEKITHIVGNEKVMKVAGLHLVSPYQAA